MSEDCNVISRKRKIKIISDSFGIATAEIMYFFLPVAIYSMVLFFTGSPTSEISTLPAWSFMALAVYFSIIRDYSKAFNRNSEDKANREWALLIGLAGIVVSTTILTLNLIKSQDSGFYISPYIHEFQ